MEFTGTEDGLQPAGELVCAHDRLGIGGYHNDSLRTIDYKLWNFKAIDTINCHERRIMYEAELCRRCLMLLSRGIWKFTNTELEIPQSDVRVESVHFSDSLLTLSYMISEEV